jgi:hypothetical protein
MVAAAAEAGAGGVWELLSPPSDSVTNVRFSSHSDHLLVSSLDLVSISLLPSIAPCVLKTQSLTYLGMSPFLLISKLAFLISHSFTLLLSFLVVLGIIFCVLRVVFVEERVI